MSTGPGLRPGSSPSGTTRQASPRAARPRPSNQTRTARLPPAKPTGKEVNEEDDATKSADIQTPLKSSLESSPSISGNAATEAALDAASAVVASQDLTQVLERLDKLEKENEALRAQVATHDAASLWVQDLRQRVTSLEVSTATPQANASISKSRSKTGGDGIGKSLDDGLENKPESEDVKQLQARMASLEGLVVELDESLNHEHLLKRVDILESGFMKLANLDAKVAKLLEKGSKAMGSFNGNDEGANDDGLEDAPPRGIRRGGGGSVDLAENFNHYAVTDNRVPTKAKPVLSSQAHRSAKAKQAKEAKHARAAAKEVAKADAKLQKNAAAAASGSNPAGGGGARNLREMMAFRRGSLRDSSFLKAAESTVVTAKALELTEEERAMNGAPEGALYVAEVLSRDKLPKLVAATDSAPDGEGAAKPTGEGPEEAVARALALLVPAKVEGAAEVPWNESFDALTTFRRVLVHHPEVLRGSPAVLAVVPGMVKCSKSLRSVLAKNALLTIEDLFYAEQQRPFLLFGDLNKSSNSSSPDSADGTVSAAASAIDALCDSCLDACASNQPKALRLVGQTTLTQASQSAPHMLCVIAQALLLRGGHKNAAVATQAVKTAQACLANLADTSKHPSEGSSNNSTGASFPWNLSALSSPLSAALNGKDPAGKQAAVACCASLAVFLGGTAAWRTAVNQTAPETPLSAVQLEELADAGDPTSAVAGGNKAKKGKKGSGRGSTFGGSFKAFMSSNKKKQDLDSIGGSIDLADNFNHYAVTDTRVPTASKPVLSSQAQLMEKSNQSVEAATVDVDSLKAVFPADVAAADDSAKSATTETGSTGTSTVDPVVESEVREMWPDIRIGKLSLAEATEVTAISVAEGDYSTDQANRIVARLTALHAEANAEASGSAGGASESKKEAKTEGDGDVVSARASSDYTKLIACDS